MDEARVGTLYGMSLAGLGLVLLAGPFAPGAERAFGAVGMGWLVPVLGMGLLAAQATLVYRGILGRATRQRAEAEELRARLGEAVEHDELTGAYARSRLQRTLGREMEAVRRYGVQTSCIMLDVDGLGLVNRERGYAAGDALLRELGRLLRENLRATDSLFRWGGGRFLLLTPHVRVDMAAHLAEKLRRMVERHAFSGGLRATITLSVAQVWPEDSSESLAGRLRSGLEKARRSGPGRLEVLRGS